MSRDSIKLSVLDRLPHGSTVALCDRIATVGGAVRDVWLVIWHDRSGMRRGYFDADSGEYVSEVTP